MCSSCNNEQPQHVRTVVSLALAVGAVYLAASCDSRESAEAASPDPFGLAACYNVQLGPLDPALPEWDVAAPNPFKLPDRLSIAPHISDSAGNWHFIVQPLVWRDDGPPARIRAYLESDSDSLLLTTVNGYVGLRGTLHRLEADTLVGLMQPWSDDHSYSDMAASSIKLIRVACLTGRPRPTEEELQYRR